MNRSDKVGLNIYGIIYIHTCSVHQKAKRKEAGGKYFVEKEDRGRRNKTLQKRTEAGGQNAADQDRGRRKRMQQKRTEAGGQENS